MVISPLHAQATFLQRVERAVHQIWRPRPTLQQLFTWWLTTPRARAMQRLDCITSRWRRWVQPELGDVAAGELTPDQVEHVLELAELQGRSAQTLNHILVDLRRVVKAARGARRWPGPDPMEFVRRRPPAPAERETLTRSEAQQLLASSSGRYRVIYALGLYLGLRKGEVLALQRDHVDVEDLVLHVRFSHGRKVTKNGRWRSLPICSELAPILLEWIEPRLIGRDRPVDSPSGDRAGEVLLFPGQSAGGRMGVDCAISKRLRFALEGLGIEKRGIRFHDLRHSFATLADEAGIAEEVVSKVLGHSPSITGRYTHRTIARLRQELERLKLQQQ